MYDSLFMTNAIHTDDEMLRHIQMGFLRLSTAGRAIQDAVQWSPAWSSDALEKALDEMLAVPGSTVAEVFRALWMLLSASNAALDTEMGNFICEVVGTCFRRNRSDYMKSSHDWMQEELKKRPTAAQAYLALICLPEPLAVLSRDDILSALEGSDFFPDAGRMLSFSQPSEPPLGHKYEAVSEHEQRYCSCNRRYTGAMT